jgi:hypothetical protein
MKTSERWHKETEMAKKPRVTGNYSNWTSKSWRVTMSTDPYIAPGNTLKFTTTKEVTNETTGIKWGSGFTYDPAEDKAKDVMHKDIDGTEGYFDIERTAGTSNTLKCTYSHAGTTTSCWTATDG